MIIAAVPLGSLASLRRREAKSLKRKLGIFGKAGAFGIGPHRELHGTPVAAWPAFPQSALRARIDDPDQFRGVKLGSPSPPVNVTGRLVGPGSDGRGTSRSRSTEPSRRPPRLQERGHLRSHLLGLRSRTVAPRRYEHGAGLRNRGRRLEALASPAGRDVRDTSRTPKAPRLRARRRGRGPLDEITLPSRKVQVCASSWVSSAPLSRPRAWKVTDATTTSPASKRS